MGDLLRTLNDNGMRIFRDYLANLRSGSNDKVPFDALADAYCSGKMQPNIEIKKRAFATRLEAGAFLYEKLQPISYSQVERNTGLWSWLALYYFDQLCPARADGSRKVGEDCRYLLELDYRRYYRHLLLGPYIVYRLYGENAPLLLWEPLEQMSEPYRELSCRQSLLMNKGVIDAANVLYYDRKRAQTKRGAGVKRPRAGSLRRFIDVIQQLDLTYDLYSMTAEQVLDLLPSEFNEWRSPGVTQ
jgi:hypothetical protein